MKSSNNNLRLLLETKDDCKEVERLLDLVFTPRRKLLSSYQLRSSANKVNKLSYVIKDSSNCVVGSIRLWKIKIDNHSSKGLLLGPLAIHPIYQSEGLGEKLVLNSMELASEDNWNWVVLGTFLGSFAYIWDGIYIGATATRSIRNAMLICGVVFFCSYWIFIEPMGNHGLWTALTIFMIARGLILTVMAPACIFRKI